MAPPTLITPALVEAAIAGHAAGKTTNEIGASLGVSGALVSKALRQQGITSRIAPDVPEQVLAAIAAGQPVRAVAKRFGIGSGSVNRIMRRAGVEPRGAGPQKILPDGTEDLVVADYTAGGSAEEIASRLGVGVRTVYRTLARRGIETREHHAIVTDEIRDAVREAAGSGGTSVEIGAAVGVAKTTVQRILGPGVLPMGRPRECELDEGAFDVLTPISARWAGFLFADGCLPVEKGGIDNILSTNISARDRSHVEQLRLFLGSSHAITTIHRGERMIQGRLSPPTLTVSYRVRSRRLVDALMRLGMAHAGPMHIPVDALAEMPQFWAGVCDGDGWIGLHQDGPAISICGHIPLLEKFRSFMRNVIGARLNITPTASGIWRIGTTGRPARRTIELFYADEISASASLARKTFRAQQQILQDKPITPYPDGFGEDDHERDFDDFEEH